MDLLASEKPSARTAGMIRKTSSGVDAPNAKIDASMRPGRRRPLLRLRSNWTTPTPSMA